MSSNITDPPDGIYRGDDEWREAHDGPEPADLRDDIPGPADLLRPAADSADPLMDVKSDGGLDLPQPSDQHLFDARPPGTPQHSVDPTLSRSVDVEAAGGNPEALGMDPAGDTYHPGTLGPSAEDQPAVADDEPAGQWGSSGSPTN